MPFKSPHQFYVFHVENKVMARRGNDEPVVAMECETAQQAYDEVQKVVNPTGISRDALGPKGFLEPAFQSKISENCREFVEAAYAKG